MSKFVKLKDVCLRITDGSHFSPEGKSNGFPMLSVKDMEENGFNYSDCKYIDEKTYQELVKADCKPLLNDVLIAKDGSYLKHVFVIEQEVEQAILSSIGILRPDLDQINPHYLKYYLQTNWVKEIVAKKYVSGSALPRIILKNFGEIDILYRTPDDQLGIANVLRKLDRKITLNYKIQTELEAMSKLVFNYKFNQFNITAEKNGSKNKALRRTAPEGWYPVELRTLCSVNERQLSAKCDWSYINYLDTSNITRNSVSNIVRLPIGERPSRAQRMVKKNDIVYSTVRPIQEHYGIMKFPVDNLIASTGFAVLTHRENPVLNDLIYLFLSGPEITQQLQKIAQNNVSAYPSINPGDILNLKIIWPKEESILIPLAKQLGKYHELIHRNQQQNKDLIKFRDWLLPMLLNGQVKVTPNAFIIPDNKKLFAKQVLAGKIVSEFKDDPHFSHIKFQKLQYLAEHVIGADLYWNYYFQAAGPYDHKFMHTISAKLREAQWFDEQERRFVPLAKQPKIEGYFQETFGAAAAALERLFALLRTATEAETEIIATVYAVWNNRLIQGQCTDADELRSDFYAWSERKQQYTDEQVQTAIAWLNKNELIPKGFGKLLKKAK